MDNDTFRALQKITAYVANKGRDPFTVEIDGALQQVWGWMDEVEKDVGQAIGEIEQAEE